MKIGLVGYQGSGKSSLYEWLTGQASDPALSHTTQSAMAPVPDDRFAPLCEIYQPKKVTYASLELVDTPGLSRTHEGNAARLAILREAGCLVLVVAGFSGAKPDEELRAFEEDLLLADMEVVTGRIERLKEQIKKPRPTKDRDQDQAELAALEPILAALEAGRPAKEAIHTDEQRKVIRAFRLLTEKPKLVIVNAADDVPGGKLEQLSEHEARITIPVGLERELARMSEEDRKAFAEEMGVQPGQRDDLIRTIMDVSGQFLYFTAGDKEVRSWMLNKGGTALDAAANIHTDLARGFIRAEIFKCEDIMRLGSEREIKAHNLLRQEPKDYVMQDGDVLHVRFSV